MINITSYNAIILKYPNLVSSVELLCLVNRFVHNSACHFRLTQEKPYLVFFPIIRKFSILSEKEIKDFECNNILASPDIFIELVSKFVNDEPKGGYHHLSYKITACHFINTSGATFTDKHADVFDLNLLGEVIYYHEKTNLIYVEYKINKRTVILAYPLNLVRHYIVLGNQYLYEFKHPNYYLHIKKGLMVESLILNEPFVSKPEKSSQPKINYTRNELMHLLSDKVPLFNRMGCDLNEMPTEELHEIFIGLINQSKHLSAIRVKNLDSYKDLVVTNNVIWNNLYGIVKSVRGDEITIILESGELCIAKRENVRLNVPYGFVIVSGNAEANGRPLSFFKYEFTDEVSKYATIYSPSYFKEMVKDLI